MENFVSVGRDRTPIYVYHAMLRILRALRIRACGGERTFDKNRWRNRFFPSEILASFTLENAFASNLADWTYPLGGRELRTALFPRLSLSLSLSLFLTVFAATSSLRSVCSQARLARQTSQDFRERARQAAGVLRDEKGLRFSADRNALRNSVSPCRNAAALRRGG